LEAESGPHPTLGLVPKSEFRPRWVGSRSGSFKDGCRMNRKSSGWVGIAYCLLPALLGEVLLVDAAEPARAGQRSSSEPTQHDLLRKGNWEQAIQMMEADPNWIAERDDKGCMPLHRAAEQGAQAAVEWLLAHGADVDAVSFDKYTPLHLAEDPAVVR